MEEFRESMGRMLAPVRCRRRAPTNVRAPASTVQSGSAE
jgi:hypothetical protein